VEEARALAGEAIGGGGRGARRWWGDARCSRKRCSLTEEAWGEGGRDAMSGGVTLGCAWSGVAGSIGQHGVRRVAWADARAGTVGWVRGIRLVGWTVGSR
jgi:hypothetical protein